MIKSLSILLKFQVNVKIEKEQDTIPHITVMTFKCVVSVVVWTGEMHINQTHE